MLVSSTFQYPSIFAAGQERHNKRRARSSTSFEYAPPHADEIQLIHDLYKQGRNLEKQLSSSHTSNTSPAPTVPGALIAAEEKNSGDIGNTTVKVPTIWMDRTMFQNTKFMHLQNRNIHG